MRYTTIFLDMDHTLCDTARADELGVRDFQHVLKHDFTHEAAQQIAQIYLRVIYGARKDRPGYQKESAESEIGYRARLLQLVMTEAGVPFANFAKLEKYATHFMNLRIKHFDFFPGVIEMLVRLRRHYSLVLVTNGPVFSQEPKLQRVNMDKYMDHILLGGLLPEQKPHPAIFSLACEKARCDRTQAVHVGDMLAIDIQGAVNAGITSVWLNSGEPTAEPEPKPDHVITHITELEHLLTRINCSD
jgi:N-acylneuraminate-9-phosphatase